MSTHRKSVSLADELYELSNAVEAARLLLDEVAHRGLGIEADTKRAPMLVVATLSMVSARLHQVRRVVRGEADARTILASHNDATGFEQDDDVVLEEWATPAVPVTVKKRKALR